jgi:hypothetical protein
MKSIAYYALHYGAEYLAWSVRSIQDAVDEIHVLYTDKPSFGYATSLQCPETEEQLFKEAHRFLKKPMIWHKGRWETQVAHRNMIHKIAKDVGADVIFTIDADELWEPSTLKDTIDFVRMSKERVFRIRPLQFWRSIHWHCTDPMMPDRFIHVGGVGEYYISQPWSNGSDFKQKYPMFHFGLAQSASLMKYRMSVSGHLPEWRPKWLEEKLLPWKPGCDLRDLHPTTKDMWKEAKPVSTEHKPILETLLGDHPYFKLDLIP